MAKWWKKKSPQVRGNEKGRDNGRGQGDEGDGRLGGKERENNLLTIYGIMLQSDEIGGQDAGAKVGPFFSNQIYFRSSGLTWSHFY